MHEILDRIMKTNSQLRAKHNTIESDNNHGNMSSVLERRECQPETLPYSMCTPSVDTAKHSETLCVNNGWMKIVNTLLQYDQIT